MSSGIMQEIIPVSEVPLHRDPVQAEALGQLMVAPSIMLPADKISESGYIKPSDVVFFSYFNHPNAPYMDRDDRMQSSIDARRSFKADSEAVAELDEPRAFWGKRVELLYDYVSHAGRAVHLPHIAAGMLLHESLRDLRAAQIESCAAKMAWDDKTQSMDWEQIEARSRRLSDADNAMFAVSAHVRAYRGHKPLDAGSLSNRAIHERLLYLSGRQLPPGKPQDITDARIIRLGGRDGKIFSLEEADDGYALIGDEEYASFDMDPRRDGGDVGRWEFAPRDSVTVGKRASRAYVPPTGWRRGQDVVACAGTNILDEHLRVNVRRDGKIIGIAIGETEVA